MLNDHPREIAFQGEIKMSSRLLHLWSLLLFALVLASIACSHQKTAASSDRLSPEQAVSTATEAYIYGYPLVTMDTPVAAFTALQGLRDKGHIQPGQKVLINGAAGGVGTLALQIAKSFGAEVTGVCSTRNVDMVRSIGADQVIDYTREDFTKSGQRYDLIFDCIGNHSLSACRRVLNLKGIFVMVGDQSGRGMIGLLARLITAACVFTVCEPEAGHVPGETEQRRSDHHARSHEGRKGKTGHRQALQLE
jgi:hypothetical protein